MSSSSFSSRGGSYRGGRNSLRRVGTADARLGGGRRMIETSTSTLGTRGGGGLRQHPQLRQSEQQRMIKCAVSSDEAPLPLYLRIRELKLREATAIAKTELDLDAIPRDSRYSQTLVDLSNREEMEPGNVELSAKIDKMMEAETRRFHHDVVKENSKRWDIVRRKLKEDRESENLQQYFQNYNEEEATIPAGAETIDNLKILRPKKVYTKLDIELEELRLDAYYNLNWEAIESFHLKEAFKSQREKVESEWNKHENQLHENYMAKRRAITGETEVVDSPKKSVGDENRWQSPEKQKSLIHTAPVLSPKHSSSPSGSGIKAARGFNRERTSSGTSLTASVSSAESINPALEKLERSYNKALRAAASQKASALRWISRQSIRLLSQCAEVHQERHFMGMIYSDLECHLKSLYQTSQAASRGRSSDSPNVVAVDHSPFIHDKKTL